MKPKEFKVTLKYLRHGDGSGFIEYCVEDMIKLTRTTITNQLLKCCDNSEVCAIEKAWELFWEEYGNDPIEK